MLKNPEVPIRSAELTLASEKFEVPTKECGINKGMRIIRYIVGLRGGYANRQSAHAKQLA